jgi:hypothetical protein
MTQYIATVTGILWEGGKGFTHYGFDHRPTRAEVIAKSGDFSQVTHIRLETRRVIRWTVKLANARLAD